MRIRWFRGRQNRREVYQTLRLPSAYEAAACKSQDIHSCWSEHSSGINYGEGAVRTERPGGAVGYGPVRDMLSSDLIQDIGLKGYPPEQLLEEGPCSSSSTSMFETHLSA